MVVLLVQGAEELVTMVVEEGVLGASTHVRLTARPQLLSTYLLWNINKRKNSFSSIY